MDPATPWAAYGQHYPPRLSGPGNAASGLPHPPQINDLALPPSLPRQDNAAGYGSGAPSLLLPAHHSLNVSTSVPPADPAFVNSSNLLSATYDSMLSSYPPSAKGHLGTLNMAHNQTLFKALGKESELNELRGGFSRRAGISQASLPPDPNVGIASGSALSPAGMYNAQSSPHSWRPSDMVSTPSSPFGVLPHEAVMQRGNNEPAAAKQQKSSHDVPQGNRFSDSDMDYRNIMSVSSHPQSSPILEPVNNPPRTPLMMPRSETISPAAETLNMNMKPSDYATFHGNGNVGGSRGSIINQNFISHGQFPPMEVHNETQNVFTPDGLSSTCKNAFGPGTKPNVASPDMFGNGLTSPVSTNSPSPAHHTLHPHHQSPISNSQLSPINSVHPSSTGSQTQSRDLSSYSAYNTTPTIPTNSQSFLANQLPNPALGVNQGYNNAGNQSAMCQATQAAHFIPMSSACSSISSPGGEMTSVAYSPVITRASMSTHINNAYNDTMGKNTDHKSVEHLSQSLPNDRQKLSNIPYDNIRLGQMDSSMNLGEVVGPTMMAHHSSSRAGGLSKHMNINPMLSADGTLGMNASSQQCAMSPRNFPINDLYGEHGRNLQNLKLNEDKMDLESSTAKYHASSHKHSETGHKKRGRRRKKRAERAESPIDTTIQITRMTPLNANKLSHKMAPSPMSFPLQRPPTSSPLGPMDLSNSELLEQSSRVLPYNCSALDGKRGATCDPHGVSMSSSSPPEISPPQLPATPMSMAGSTGTISCGSMSPKHKKAYPSIEDDLGFLAELPAACNVGTGRISHQKSSYANSSSSSSTNGSFLESFLKFVRGDAPAPATTTAAPKKGRPRIRDATNAAYLCASTSAAGDSQWELNPTTGLFTESIPNKDSSSSQDRIVNASAQLAEKVRSEKRNVERSNYDVPRFSSDDDDEDFSANEVVQCSIDRLSDTLSSEKSGAGGNTEKNDSRPQLKIKLVGLQSGNLKMAQKTKSPRRKRRKSDTKMIKSRTRRVLEDDCISNITDFSEEDSTHSYEKPSALAIPQRETSMRKCKEKVMKTRQEEMEKRKQQTFMDSFIPGEIKQFLISDSDKEASESNSDSDPAWTPIRRDGNTRQHRHLSVDDDKSHKPTPGRSRRHRKASRLSFHRIKQRRIKKPVQVIPNDSWNNVEETEVKESVPIESNAEVNDEPVCHEESNNNSDAPSFQTGDFIVSDADIVDENPTVLWRVDGKSLLQKFEPFQDDTGKMYYRGKSSYCGLVGSKQKDYRVVQVRLINCDRNSFVIEYLGLQSSANATASLNSETETKPQNDIMDLTQQKESFEVYIQTLISQALDHNFISEIVKEEDEYFLSHLHEIDKVVDKCKTGILSRTEWSDSFKCCIEQFPELNWTSEDDDFLGVESSCQACFLLKPCLQKLSFSGQPYSAVTLLVQKNPDVPLQLNEKEFRICSACSETITLYNQIYHQKFRLFTVCSWKVREIQQADRDKESHVILEFCLEDADWINKLFEQTLNLWRKCLWYNR